MIRELLIVEGLEFIPLFRDRDSYERFRLSYADATKDKLDDNAKRRAKSELRAGYYFVH